MDGLLDDGVVLQLDESTIADEGSIEGGEGVLLEPRDFTKLTLDNWRRGFDFASDTREVPIFILRRGEPKRFEAHDSLSTQGLQPVRRRRLALEILLVNFDRARRARAHTASAVLGSRISSGAIGCCRSFTSGSFRCNLAQATAPAST